MWGGNTAKSHPHEKLFHVNSPMSNKGRASYGAFPSEKDMPPTFTNILNLLMQGGGYRKKRLGKEYIV